MSELEELYQELLLEHARSPRNFGKLEEASSCVKGHNPICGDKIEVCLIIDDDIVKEVGFDGTGCAISMASASVMSELVKNKSLKEALSLFDVFHKLVTGEIAAESLADELEDLQILAGVKQYPIRVKCATLSWHAMRSALDSACDEQAEVSTE